MLEFRVDLGELGLGLVELALMFDELGFGLAASFVLRFQDFGFICGLGFRMDKLGSKF